MTIRLLIEKWDGFGLVRAWRMGIPCLLFGWAIAANSQAIDHIKKSDDPFVKWMQIVHDDWAVPRYEALDRSSHSLLKELQQTCEAGVTPDRLRRSQLLWRETMLTWRQLEALQFGPTLERRTSKKIDFWPTRPAVIEQAVANTAPFLVDGPEATEAMDRWGVAAKGLPALEWLLFPAAKELPPVTRSAAHCLYARRLSSGVAMEAQLLLSAWRAEADLWRSSSPPELERSKFRALNLLIGSIELLRNKKLEKALRIHTLEGPGTKGALEAFDSVRSQHTKLFLLAHVDALSQLLIGRTAGLTFTRTGPRWGLDDVITAENPELGRQLKLRSHVVAIRTAVNALPRDPHTWTPATLKAPVHAFNKLRSQIDPPIANAWKVRIEFTDADGD